MACGDVFSFIVERFVGLFERAVREFHFNRPPFDPIAVGRGCRLHHVLHLLRDRHEQGLHTACQLPEVHICHTRSDVIGREGVGAAAGIEARGMPVVVCLALKVRVRHPPGLSMSPVPAL